MNTIGQHHQTAFPVANQPTQSDASSIKSQAEMESVGKDFEGVFLSMMIKEMRNTLDGGFFGEEASDTYGGMFDMFIGQHLADSKPLGVADMLLEQYRKMSSANDANQAADSSVTPS